MVDVEEDSVIMNVDDDKSNIYIVKVNTPLALANCFTPPYKIANLIPNKNILADVDE